MISPSNRGPKLADEENALDLYLDALLGDGQTDDEEAVAIDTLVAPRPERDPILDAASDVDETMAEHTEFDAVKVSAILAETSASVLAAIREQNAKRDFSESTVATPALPSNPVAVSSPSVVAVEPEPEPEPVCQHIGPLPCLVLKRSGSAIAVRVHDIDVVVEWSGNVERAPAPLEGHCGTLPYAGKQAVIVDIGATAFRLGASHYSPIPASYVGTRLVIVGGGRLALICDEIGQMLSVKPDEVTWANAATPTPWNMGVLKRSPCMLINMGALVDFYCGQPPV